MYTYVYTCVHTYTHMYIHRCPSDVFIKFLSFDVIQLNRVTEEKKERKRGRDGSFVRICIVLYYYLYAKNILKLLLYEKLENCCIPMHRRLTKMVL